MKGPPRRGLNRIAFSGQLSPHDWQAMSRFARQASVIDAKWSKRRAPSGSKTGSGHASLHSPQKVHSADVKSSEGRPSTSFITPVGQRSTQRPHPVQDWKFEEIVPGGRIRSDLLAVVPRRNERRVEVPSRMTLMPQGAGRAEDDLPHPDGKPIRAHNAHSDDWPDTERKDKECQQFAAPPAMRHPIRRVRIHRIGHDALPLNLQCILTTQ